VREISYLYAITRRLDPENRGVLVTNVIAAGPAGLAGLAGGDIVRRVNGVEIRELDDLRRAVLAARLARDAEVLLLVQRGNDTALVNIRTDW
jgi:S1-C subfamily serine protease